MEIASYIEMAIASVTEWTTFLMAVDLPIPDIALIFAFLLIAYAAKQSARAAHDSVRADVERLYQSELLLTNRRAQQAKTELRKAQLEIERERQKRRRDTGRVQRSRNKSGPKLVQPIEARA